MGFKISNLADLLIEQFSVARVVICELFKRPNPPYFTPDEYEDKRVLANKYLGVVLATTWGTRFWEHKRTMDSPIPIFDNDGVHLNKDGNKKLYRSLRLAIKQAVDSLYDFAWYRYFSEDS